MSAARRTKSASTGSPLNAIERDLQAGKIIVVDGATGTELERRGAAMHDKAWCATATLTDPELLRGVHEDYIRAGARVITANTFSTNRNMLDPAGLGSRFEELNRRAVELAREARDRTGMAGRVAIAGSMSHQVPVMASADQRDVNAVPHPELAEANFREMAELLATTGVDLILMEMMSDPELANPAIKAAVATGLPVWAGFSVREGEAGEVVAYARPDLGAAEMFGKISLDGVRVAGVMHSKVDTIMPAVGLLRRVWSGPLMAYPDSGYFKMPHWQFVDIIPVDDFVAYSREWIAAGVQVIGGCCGLGVRHIEALTGRL
jgi:S-methylmethionine-dependent homocysteine/selenocysteine methylase